MQLTPHFSLSEFTRSAKATALGLDNTPTAMAQTNLLRTAQMLERVRDYLKAPITITSGYRGPVLNKSVGGATSSDHLQGLAADVVVPKFGRPYDVAKALAPQIDALGIGQIIYEVSGDKHWVHLSARVPTKPSNRVITILAGRDPMLGVQRV